MVQENSLNKKILIICGPTASGKTALAVKCAKMLNSEVISADSMYIYKDLNIGTAKPTVEEMDGVVHHLIDVVSPFDNFSVSDYKALAQPILDNLLSQGKIPVICGGTGFYINSLLYELSYGNANANLEIREKYKQLALEKGNDYVYNILKEVDPKSAEKLHPNDVKRVIRALEIFESGTKKSDIIDDIKPKYDYRAFAVAHERQTLYDRINLRVDNMVSDGLLDEMKRLIDLGITKDNQSMQAIGYKEFFDYFENKQTLEQTIELVKLNTRHYAKRQITFFKKLNVEFLQPCDMNVMAENIVKGLI